MCWWSLYERQAGKGPNKRYLSELPCGSIDQSNPFVPRNVFGRIGRSAPCFPNVKIGDQGIKKNEFKVQ